MLTARAFWFLITAGLILAAGFMTGMTTLILLALSLLLWFGYEWLTFLLRLRATLGMVELRRKVHDDRGPVQTMWTGRTFEVRLELHLDDWVGLAHVSAADFVPFTVERLRAAPVSAGPLRRDQPLTWKYHVRCTAAGVARFEGVRLQISDLQGFFYHVAFLRRPVEFPVLPLMAAPRMRTSAHKQDNVLMPPGIHRLPRPGSGSELLDLRDYRPGDPPKTIAWKVSARRNRLITKEFESEVPVRCLLFLDTSSSVRVPSLNLNAGQEGRRRETREWDEVRGRSVASSSPLPPLPSSPSSRRPLDRLIDIATGVVQASTRIRDLAGLCLVNDESARVVRPGRTGMHVDRMLRELAQAAREAPTDPRIDPDALTPWGHALAVELYPELMRPPANTMPVWLTFLGTAPGYTRHRTGIGKFLYRNKWRMLMLAFMIVPACMYLLNWALTLWLPRRALTPLLLASFYGTLGFFLISLILVLFTLLFTRRRRLLSSWRKRLSALLAVRYRLGVGAIEALREDDDAFSLWLQRFLNDHQAPWALPLYDPQGRYRFASPSKIEALSRALLQAAGRGKDNELYVLLVDLLESDDHLDPLIRAIKVAQGRHHQVMVICPWPAGPPPGRQEDRRDVSLKELEELPVGEAIARLQERRLEKAFHRLRRQLARLGVQVICAAEGEPVGLILDRLDQMRGTKKREYR